VAGLAAVVALAIFAPTAAADQPVVVHKTSSLTSVLTGACPFSITVDSTMTETDRFYSDQNGVLIRANAHVDEQDSFSANGKSLTGDPYTVNLHAFFDSSGNITEEYADGIIERVTLPDGSVFQSAGRVDFGADGFPAFAVTSDYGSARNLDGFCAALSA
jgi:flagellar hook assembly protein FlgD